MFIPWLFGEAHALETVVLTAEIYGVLAFDADNDGLVDLVSHGPWHTGLAVHHNVGGILGPREDLWGEGINVAVAIDTDGDGLLDLCRTVDDDISCHRNLGGTFAAPVSVATGSGHIYALEAVDFDGDGDTDLVSAASAVDWHDNDGAGAFAPHEIWADRTLDVAAGDLDGDGDPDLLLTDSSSFEVHWVENGGNTFTATPLIASADDARRPVIVDVDGDGDLDPVVLGGGNQGDPGVVWYPNLGSGDFGTAVHLTHDVGAVCLAADIDGDGTRDLVAPDGGQGLVWLPLPARTGGGPLAAPGEGGVTVTDLAVADFDADGAPDVVSLTQDVDLWPAAGDVNIRVDRGAVNVSALDVGDIDGDGHDDIVYTSSFDHRLAVHRGTATGWGPPEPIRTLVGGTVGLADLDGDGDLDLVVAAADGLLHLENAGGTFGPEETVGAGIAYPDLVGMPDLDGDGDVDLVVLVDPYGVMWFANDGSGTFGLPTALLTVRPASADTADVDGDGDLDLIASAGHTIVLVRATAPGVFAAPEPIGATGTDPTNLLAGDLDGDGDTDLVYQERACPYDCGPQVVALPNDGAGGFGPPVVLVPPYGIGTPFVLSDVDADGLLDVVGPTGTHLAVFFAAPGAGRVDLVAAMNPSDFVVRDLDRDGDLDLAVGNYGELFVLLDEEPTLPPSETGHTADTGSSPDTDAGTPEVVDPRTPPDRGCGCSSGGPSGAWLLVFLIVARRRETR